jgi:hypothetical protein
MPVLAADVEESALWVQYREEEVRLRLVLKIKVPLDGLGEGRE